MTRVTVISDISDWASVVSLAHRDSGMTSVGLKAVALVIPTSARECGSSGWRLEAIRACRTQTENPPRHEPRLCRVPDHPNRR